MKLCSSEEKNLQNKIVSTTPNKNLSSEDSIIYNCPLCSFLSEERRIFEKHLQSHRSSSFKRVSPHVTNTQSFCDACNIQFMSADTYQVHKTFYCKSRHDKEEPLSIPGAFQPSPDTVILHNGAAPSLIQPQAIYAAISTNPLILLPCSIVSGESLVAQNNGSSSTTGIVLQTSYPAIVGKHPPVLKKEETSHSRKTSHPAISFSSTEVVCENSIPLRKRKMSEGDVLNLKKPLKLSDSDEGVPPDAPLDLSLKKRKVSEKRTIEIMECSSIPSVETCSSPKTTDFHLSGLKESPSSTYSNDSNQCSHEAVPVMKPIERISPSPPLLQAEDKSTGLPPDMPPPKVLKHGNNVCEQCNIVFYKYDNYLAHKKHYCAYRRQQLSVLAAAAAASSSSGTGHEHSSDDSNHSAVHEVTRPYSADEISKPVLRRMDNVEPFHVALGKPVHSTFICDACGVKFSSLDTLNAHQTYYCSKREDSVMSKYVRSRNENSGSLEPPFSGPEEWKCNYCETTCSSYETIRRHLLTHSELRGFRCLLCGYKGNTLRGMRAHACEHLSESSSSIEEFMSSTVISENDALPVARPSADLSDGDTEASKDHNKYSTRKTRGVSERSRDEDQTDTELSDLREKNSPNPTYPQELDSSCVKVETRDNSTEESVNPLSLCDVVIKTEHTSSDDESSGEIETCIKSELDSDSDSQDLARSESPPVQPISVIRCGPDKDRRDIQFEQNSEKSSDNQTRPRKLKYCKSCDISFYHMSNFVAHKKYYCSHPPISSCVQEATTVQ